MIPAMMPSEIASNLASVRRSVGEAARRSGRSPDAITLVAVSKLQPVENIRAAYAAGQRVFGENYVREALEKMPELPGDCVWHLIGHLQTNKARQAPGRFHWVETVDSVTLARALERHAAEAQASLDVLVQVNWSEESTKSGVAGRDALRELVRETAAQSHLRLRGLMTIPDPQFTELELRRCFGQMRTLRGELAVEFGLAGRLTELSMGMSHDYAWAIEEGATIVRVGTAIFGARS